MTATTHTDPERLLSRARASLVGAVVYAIRYAPPTMTTVERMDHIAAALVRYESAVALVEQAAREVA